MGTEDKDSAPVEDKIFFSSKSMPGRETGSEPVLTIVFSASIIVFLLLLSKIEILLAELKLPMPLKYVTLFFLNKNSIPFVRTVTALF